MTVKCIANNGKAFIDYEIKPAFTSEQTVYGGLDVDENYAVMALCEYENNIYYLVDSHVIGFYPYQLFEVVDNKVPSEWFFNINRRIDSVYMKYIFGYYEICFSNEHYNNLLEQDEGAIALFFIRRKDIFNI